MAVGKRTLWSCSPILPKKFEDRFMVAALKEYMNDTADDMVKDLEKPIKNWKHKVLFKPQVTAYYSAAGMEMEIVIEINDDPYSFMDGGTKKHMIRPRYKKVLHWVDPKTGEDRFSKGHMVKGIKARNWTSSVKRKWDKKLVETFQMLMRDYAVRTGFAA